MGGRPLPAGASREDAGQVDIAQHELQEKEEIWRAGDGTLNRKQESRGVFKAGLFTGAQDVPRGISGTDLERAGWDLAKGYDLFTQSVFIQHVLTAMNYSRC